ncbi:MAG: inorganic phosphate transporter [Deltaproteobacteria bacterium]|jgi:PiT family inorganic phosphate transporter|nr:inorganic phosphate transporter [Deltaproteobacteria bacterium]
MDIIILAVIALLGLYMAWNIGANDVANSMADAVGSGALSVKQAVIAAGICEFAGAVLVGSHVTDTIRKGIVDPSALSSMSGMLEGEAAALLVIGMAAALLSAAIWLHIATWTGMPVSTTHSIVGAVAGFGIVAAGIGSVNWGKMGQIVASWFISPFAGGLMAFIIFKIISRLILGHEKPVKAAIKITPYIVFFLAMVVTLATIYKGLKHVLKGIDWLTDTHTLLIAFVISVISTVISRLHVAKKLAGKEILPLAKQLELVEEVYVPLVIISSCAVAFAHGANDVANSVGPLAAVANILKTGTVEMKVPVPLWILMLGGIGIVLGLATYGYRVMATVGTKITEITPTRGVAADIAATATVLICTRMKLPVSTTHTLVGAIMGIGLARGLAGIDSRIAKKIFKSWLITVPAAAVVCIILFLLGRTFMLDFVRELVLAARVA